MYIYIYKSLRVVLMFSCEQMSADCCLFIASRNHQTVSSSSSTPPSLSEWCWKIRIVGENCKHIRKYGRKTLYGAVMQHLDFRHAQVLNALSLLSVFFCLPSVRLVISGACNKPAGKCLFFA